MRDLNFFEGYIEKKEFKINRKIIYLISSAFIILSLITTTIYNEIIIRQDTKIVTSLRAIAENPKTLKKIEDIKSKEAEVNQFRESVEKIKSLDKIIEDRDVIDEILLGKINDSIPEELFLTSLSVKNEDIYIVGISKDKWSVAEFQKRLESLENYEEIFISNITRQEDYYNFSLNITLRGEGEDGESIEEN